MRVLCTGGAGYVGSACLRHLLKEGHDAFAYDNLSEGNAGAVDDASRRLVVGDLADAALLEDTMRRLSIDAVMHFAAVASVPESLKDPASYWHHNVVGTKTLLDAMRKNEIRNLVFSSTAATYAFTDEMPLREDSPQVPVTPYGTTKLACETMIEEYARAYGLDYTIMRYFNASGADPDGEHGEDRKEESHLVPLALKAALGQRAKLQIYGNDWPTRDGTCVRDFVHVLDIAQAHELAMKSNEGGAQRVYNIGSSVGTTVLEVIQACERVTGRSVPYEIADRRPGDPAVLIASSRKLAAELHWNPRFDSIDAIIETAARWHERHPRGYS